MVTTLYPGIPFSPQATITNNIGAADTIIEVSDVSAFPPAPNLATIGTDGEGETILYTAKTSTALSGCQRGIEGTPKAWTTGELIGRNFTAKDHADLISAVKKTMADLEAKQNKLTGESDQVVGFGPDGTAQAIQRWINLNLLANWYFANPVNRLEQAMYTGNVRCIDRWTIVHTNGSVTINDDSISVLCAFQGGYYVLSQRLENFKLKKGQRITFSALYKNLTGDSPGFYIRILDNNDSTIVSSASQKTEASGIVSVTYTAEKDNVIARVVISQATGCENTSVDLIAAKLELGSVQTLAHQEGDTWVLNEMPNYAEQYAICSQYSPITGGFVGSQHSNEQLLYNAFWGDGGSIVNQRGEKEYTLSGSKTYCIDGWFGTSGTFSIADDHCRFISNRTSAYKRIGELTETAIKANHTYTISILAKVNTASGYCNLRPVLSSLAGVPGAGMTALRETSDYELFTLTFTPTSDYNGVGAEILCYNSEYSYVDVDIMAWKFELGPVQTLAHKEGDTWILNDPPPNKALELAKCQRYFYRESNRNSNAARYATGIAASAAAMTIVIPMPVTMRASPVVSVSSPDCVLYSKSALGSAQATTDISRNGVVSNRHVILSLSGTFEAGTPYNIYMAGKSYIDFSAEL